MKLLRQFVLVVVLVGGLLSAIAVPTAQASIDSVSGSGTCSSVTVTVGYTRNSLTGTEDIGASMYAGPNPGAGTFLGNTSVLLPENVATGQVTLTLNFAEQPEGTHLFLFIAHWGVEVQFDNAAFEYDCSNTAASSAAGCTEFVDLPEQAVVGRFNSNSEIYWMPDHAIVPMIYVEGGRAYYVAGQDESEQFYKVLISCEWVWVRKDTVDPNYDEVWNGAPLPTKIVE